jgi:hypothetical protein
VRHTDRPCQAFSFHALRTAHISLATSALAHLRFQRVRYNSAAAGDGRGLDDLGQWGLAPPLVVADTFKALRRISLDPSGNTRIARAALVLLQLEHGRTT